MRRKNKQQRGIHAADIRNSERLQPQFRLLARNLQDGVSGIELARAGRSNAVGTDCSEIRKQLRRYGWDVDCRFAGLTARGRRRQVYQIVEWDMATIGRRDWGWVMRRFLRQGEVRWDAATPER